MTSKHSNENDHNNKVSISNVFPQNKIHLADEMQVLKTRMCKLEEDNKNILRKLEELIIASNSK